MAPTAEARKPECQGTMSMCIEVSKEGFDIFYQVLSHIRTTSPPALGLHWLPSAPWASVSILTCGVSRTCLPV